jgi:hypothetical protein
MGKRSNFERREADFYPTPRAAVLPLVPYLRGIRTFGRFVWIPGTKDSEKDNFAWYRFSTPAIPPARSITRFAQCAAVAACSAVRAPRLRQALPPRRARAHHPGAAAKPPRRRRPDRTASLTGSRRQISWRTTIEENKMSNVVDINPYMPDVREILRDPKGYMNKKAAKWRAKAERVRLCGEAPQQVLNELADDMERIADKMEAFPAEP